MHTVVYYNYVMVDSKLTPSNKFFLKPLLSECLKTYKMEKDISYYLACTLPNTRFVPKLLVVVTLSHLGLMVAKFFDYG